MQIAPTIQALRALRRASQGRVGFVPTMGALHPGHISLIEAARKECDVVVCSLFVNPKQFGPNEDFDKYPRVFERDCELLGQAKVDYVFAPSPQEMYPPNFMCSLLVSQDPPPHEALSRPGFFNGVATVVTKLFNIVQPDAAFFGQKDAIQCIVIRNLITDLNFPIEMRIVPTMREEDGLAMSSRNRYLTPEERSLAPIFYKALETGQKLAKTKTDRDSIIAAVSEVLKHPDVIVDYISFASLATGQETLSVGDGALLSAAIKIGKTRLIDNVLIE